MQGLRDIEDALAALPKATSKAVVRRSLKKELQPVADMANALWPGADDSAFAVSARVKRTQPQPSESAFGVSMFVGNTQAAPHAHLLEWGTAPRYHESGKYVGAVAPQPMLTPAWDTRKDQILSGLAAALRAEIAATVSRRAKKGL
ncbi:hypothetical protein SAMN06265373_108141 [Shimia sagamensis]|uniref:HK97 gp10 family phage protein n=2 Tax=Shimia sagamensis TaxID=1566352 RepID=A0ABY1PDP5_9RHOB|nr:hypothetical protein SAMN06265373_108141 [Shimia sagamensis]